jgi:nucleoside-diphosphate-sugar epimerase
MSRDMTVLVTGGAGFLGARLIDRLLTGSGDVPAPDRVVCVDRTACPIADPRIESRIGNLASPVFAREVVSPDVVTIWHLAAVLSGQSEAEFELGMSVNLDGTRALLDACRQLAHPPRFVFSSTVAVFGGRLPAVVPEDQALRPETSYGTAKAMAELLVLEYTRRGVVDGVVCRVPTVAVRPGQPNSAVSSFVSGIVREPVAGVESVCPVPVDTPIWVGSPEVTTANLAHAGRLDSAALGGVRAVNLPGVTVTPAQLLASLERHAGAPARARVRLDEDPGITRMVTGWPGAFDITRALALGFRVDADADAIVRQYVQRLTRDA